MVSAVFDNIEELADLVGAEDADLSAQGWEILGCLDASVRWQLASHLISPRRSAWRLATQCLFPEPLAQMRLARFRVRCAQLRLLLLRERGIEPEEWMWSAVEQAEQLAAGRLSARRHQRLLQETEYLRDPWRHEVWDQHDRTLGDDEIDLTMIPDDWPGRCWETGEDLDIEAMRKAPAEAGLSDCWERQDLLAQAERAVAYVLVEQAVDAWGDAVELVPVPETVAEWALQRRLWEAIMLHSGDGLDILYSRPAAAGEAAPAAEPAAEPARRDGWQLSWG